MLRSEIPITEAIIKKHGLSMNEYQMIKDALGRDPNLVELGMYSVMWSEHCSYKNSRAQLKNLPTKGDRILVGAGEENAGAVDIGNGWCVVFKIESHNHPSAIEPFQGAATGVGGIIRDIFTMGARPIALMNSLRFGSLENPKVRVLLDGVVSGIAHYGNCIGIPTVAGEVYFDDAYMGNPLVNAFCLGLARKEDLILGKASGVGNPVFYVGAATGRDGIHGATFASEEIHDKSIEERSSVQVADPFMQKLLVEACLEFFKKSDCVVGVQDMGAAGLTCSTSETASRGDAGIVFDVGLVPKREKGMTPYEILLSESQERMLVIVKKGREKEVLDIFSKWDLHAVQIGEVCDGDRMKVLENGTDVANIPVKTLTSGAPICYPKNQKPVWQEQLNNPALLEVGLPSNWNDVFLKIIASPSIASKAWIYSQYDHMVMTNTVSLPGSDAAILRLREAKKWLAMCTDCNGRYCYINPYIGAMMAVFEASRNLVVSGADPIGVTNCLNFGNPTKPEVYWQFTEAIKGMKDACLALNIPVTGGNVSFYNENPTGAVYPTPVIGMVGIVEEEKYITKSAFKQAGDRIYLVGHIGSGIGGSEYLSVIHQKVQGPLPEFSLEDEMMIQNAVKCMIRRELLMSAHDCSEGGIAVAIAESAIGGMLGADCDIHCESGLRLDELFFNESSSRVIVSISPKHVEDFDALIKQLAIPVQHIGVVTESKKLCLAVNGNTMIEQPIKQIEEAWSQSIPSQMSIV